MVLEPHRPLAIAARASGALQPVRSGRFRGIELKVVPVPAEGYPFWNELTRLDGLPEDGPLTERDVGERGRALANRRIGAVMHFQRKGRFVNKATRNVRRLRYVDALFDDAEFVHVVRDPRAAVASLLRVAFWPDITVWCEANVTPRQWADMGNDETELAAKLWASDVATALTDRAVMPADRIAEVRYEELVDEPRRIVTDLARRVGLGVTERFVRSLAAFDASDRDAASRSVLTNAQLDTITRIAGPVAERIGYTW